MGDVQKMLAVRAGDMPAFESLVATWMGPLTRFFDRLLGDPALAEEFAQEVFCRIYQHRQEYEPRASFAAYLYRVARNLWVDHVRRRAAAPRTLSLEAEPVALGVPEPRELLEARERAAAVRAAVAALPEKLRLVFVLGEAQGMSYAEVAEVLEIPVGTVKSRMHAAVLQLRGALVDA